MYRDSHLISVVKVLVGTLDAKDASSVVHKLNTRFPLTDLRHLKRIKPMFSEDGTKTGIIKIIIALAEGCLNANEQLKADFNFQEVEEVFVPEVQPLTTGQFARFSALWPVIFHHSLVEKQSGLDLHTAVELYTKFKDGLKEDCECMIVDPETQMIIGKSSDSVMRAIESVAIRARTAQLPSSQYLCTNYHVLLKREPCFMCAMALVHSRVASVVFTDRDPVRGALCSQADCTWIQACNHRYRIYQAK
jgi:tRNA(Arg) A34 adenosine deaminase TadA